jgi:hypothetical protein
MAASIFGEKAIVPNKETLSVALKDNQLLWDKMISISGGKGEWKFYTKAAGWTCSVKKNKRTLFYMMPKDSWFQLIFVYGERAFEAAKSAGLPEQVLNDLLQAKAYIEGRSVAINVNSDADMDTAEKLLQLKLDY